MCATDISTLCVDVPEAARLLSLGTTKTWALVRDGSIPSFRLGTKSVRIRVSDLERVLEAAARGDSLGRAASQ